VTRNAANNAVLAAVRSGELDDILAPLGQTLRDVAGVGGRNGWVAADAGQGPVTGNDQRAVRRAVPVDEIDDDLAAARHGERGAAPVYPLKLNGPLEEPGAPATNAKVTVLVAGSCFTHWESTAAAVALLELVPLVWPQAMPGTPRASSRTMVEAGLMVFYSFSLVFWYNRAPWDQRPTLARGMSRSGMRAVTT
jgi:hypothetical protein